MPRLIQSGIVMKLRRVVPSTTFSATSGDPSKCRAKTIGKTPQGIAACTAMTALSSMESGRMNAVKINSAGSIAKRSADAASGICKRFVSLTPC